MKIRIIGDIRTGNLQPSLTGNPIVDDALIKNFCNKLRSECYNNNILLEIVIDHQFNGDPQDDIIIIDQNIFKLFNDKDFSDKVIPIDRNDLLWGNTDNSLSKLNQLNYYLLQKAE